MAKALSHHPCYSLYSLKMPLILIIFGYWRLSTATVLQIFLLTLGFLIYNSKIALA